MTPIEKARKWAEENVPEWVKNYVKKKYISSAGKAVDILSESVERAYLAGMEEANRWVPVEESPEYLDGYNHFAIPRKDGTGYFYITGYLDEDGEIVYSHNNRGSKWHFKDADYFMPVSELPQPPKQEP